MPFLLALYASTRADELARAGWPPDAQRAFAAQQFGAQHKYYRTFYPDAEWLIVERDGEPLGRLYLDRSDQELRIVDISLIPSYRGKGLGTAMLRDLLAHAAASGRRVSLQVDAANRASALYRRLGFEQVGEPGVYLALEWRPGASNRPQANTAS